MKIIAIAIINLFAINLSKFLFGMKKGKRKKLNNKRVYMMFHESSCSNENSPPVPPIPIEIIRAINNREIRKMMEMKRSPSIRPTVYFRLRQGYGGQAGQSERRRQPRNQPHNGQNQESDRPRG